MPVPWRRGWSPAGSLLGPGEAAPGTCGLATPQRYPAHAPAHPAAQHASSLRDSLSQRQSHPRAPSPAHGAEGPSSPVQGLEWVGSCHRKARGGECSSPGPMGPWGDGHPSTAEHLPGFHLEHGLPPRQRPCNVSRCPVGSPFWPLLRPAVVKEIPHPTQPGRGLAHTRPIPHLAPAPGPLQLIPDPKGTWALPKAQQKDVCVCSGPWRARRAPPSLPPTLCSRKRRWAFRWDWGPPGSTAPCRAARALWAWHGQGREGPADVPSSDCGGRGHVAHCRRSPLQGKVNALCADIHRHSPALLSALLTGAAAGPGLCTHLR